MKIKPLQKKIMIIAGEASGDQHAAKLVKEIRQKNSHIQFIGMGSSHLREEDVELIVDSTKLAVIGSVEVLSHIKDIYAAKKKICNHLRTTPPDLLILVDYPGFNLHIARIATQLNITVLYYISPQIWAYRRKRVKRVRKYVNLMAVLFPFERDFYQRENIPVKFVGHPLVDKVKPQMSPKQARALFNLTVTKKTIALLPGSRKNEIKHLTTVLIKTAELLHAQHPETQFLLPLASTLTEQDLQPYLNNTNLPIEIVRGHTYDAIKISDLVITASGTATLEIALLETPLIITYITAPITYYLVKFLIQIDVIGLCNIVAKEKIVQEFIQNKAKPKMIAEEASKILTDENYRTTMINNLAKVKQTLTQQQGQQNLAEVVLEMLARGQKTEDRRQ